MSQNANESPTATKQKREVSIAWEQFKKNSERTQAICNYCGKSLKTAGNTTNLIDHLRHVHPDRLQVEKNHEATSLDIFVDRAPSYYNSDSARKCQIDKKVMNMIAVDVQPFSCVEDEGFIELLKELDPRYKLPSRRHLRDEILPTQYATLRKKLSSILDSVDFLALTTDLWTSKANKGYITITCHFVSKEFKLMSAIFSIGQLLTHTNHTSSNMASTLTSSSNRFSPSNSNSRNKLS